MRKLLFVVSLITMVSCASRRAPAGPPLPPPIKSIAVVAGDPLASAIGAELFNQGFRTFELPANQDMTARALQALAGRGVDAVLTIKSTRGLDSFPDNATVRVLRAQNAATVTEFNWSNSAARKNVADSARELVRTLQQTVPKP